MKKLSKILVLILAVAVLGASLVGCKNVDAPSADPTQQETGNPSNPQVGANPTLSGTSQNAEGDELFTVTFQTNGGTAVDPITAEVISQAPVSTRQYSSSENYILYGWYLNAEFTGQRVVFPYTPTANVTMYAKWDSPSVTYIRTAGDFFAINDGLGGNYVLANDITLPDSFSPIGWTMNDKGEYYAQTFFGTFDGGGYTIRGLNLRPIVTEDENGDEVLSGPVRPDTSTYAPVNLGVFGKVGSFAGRVASIRNVRVEDFRIELRGNMSRFNIGALVGYLEEGTVSNCSASGTFINPLIEYEEGFLDGLVGSYATPTSRCNIGGLVGKVGGLVPEEDPNDRNNTIDVLYEATITACSASFVADSKSYSELLYIGGLAGYVEQGSQVSRSYTTGVSISGGKYSGGFVGFNNGIINNCYAYATVQTDLKYPTVAGGFVALNYEHATINIAYSAGEVSSKLAGGFVGINDQRYTTSTGAVITNAYSTSTVYGSEYAGGFVGRTLYGRIMFCMSFGNVTADNVEISYDPNDQSQLIYKYTSHHPTYAGGFSAESFESDFTSCLAFSKNITAKSINPSGIRNIAYATNGVGQSSRPNSGIYGLAAQLVYRNEVSYTAGSYNSSPALTYQQAADVAYLTGSLTHLVTPGLGYDPAIWNFNNIDIESNMRPTLRNILG